MICVFQVRTLCWYFDSPSNYKLQRRQLECYEQRQGVRARPADPRRPCLARRRFLHNSSTSLFAPRFYWSVFVVARCRRIRRALRVTVRAPRRNRMGGGGGRGHPESARGTMWRHHTRCKGQDEDDTHQHCNFVNLSNLHVYNDWRDYSGCAPSSIRLWNNTYLHFRNIQVYVGIATCRPFVKRNLSWVQPSTRKTLHLQMVSWVFKLMIF